MAKQAKATVRTAASHAAQNRENQESCRQRQRHPVGNRHREKIARCRECHQGRKQQQTHDVEDHGIT
jgi:hypothetical protein